MTDAELIARAVVGDDRHAYAELVRRHQSAVRACLRRLTAGNHALADDLAQETFVLAWRNLKSFRQEARFSSWLYQITVNLCRDRLRRRKGKTLVSLDALEEVGPVIAARGPAAQDLVLQLDLRRAVRRAIGALPEE